MLKIGMKFLLTGVIALGAGAVFAGEQAAVKVSAEMFTVNNLWMLVATALVFIMHLGFATLEAGLTRSKNTVNILFKNVMIIAIGLLTYALAGFNLMYNGDNWVFGKFFGFGGFGLSCPDGAAGLIGYNGGAYTYWTDFIFQGMFAATAATIVSGAVAERVKLDSFLIFSTIYVALVYPIVGSWGWGKGWLDQLNFHDFAGSTFVHSVGGWAALAAVILLGPRTGKYVHGVSKPIWGHNMPLATIGALLLWFGWFGFNGGSVLSADPGAVSYVFVTTSLAAAAGIVAASLTSWKFQKHPDLSMVLNGCLAGLVGVTAGADVLSIKASIIVGAVAGIIVILAVFMFDRLHLDDPVGALSVHLVCGIWGTLAVGIFCDKYSFVSQLIGVLAAGAFCTAGAFAIFLPIKYVMGIRMPVEDEIRGLDICEHGMDSYHGFQIFTTQ
ncbi:MAG: ammonium transporter [Victivallaceae bacterium]|nr:ammonium transporter [Victivallaceae bacterium]